MSEKDYKTLVDDILIGVEKLLDSKQQDLTKNKWLTSKEVMELLKITAVTLWNYDKKGLTKPKKVGSRKRYRSSDIIAILSLKESR